ncbi:MAG: flavodoxin domain-containing protein [Candidatus Thorarchaeota archaeon]
MTRVGIVYSTKRRKATVQVVEWLKAAFESNGLEVEVGKPEEIGTLNSDLFVLGTSVYAGQVQESILEFVSQNQDLLREKLVATFVVCKEVETPECHMNLVIEKLPKEPMTWINFEGYVIRKGDFGDQQSKANTWVKDIIGQLS